MKRPNILFVFTDQQRWDTTGLGGNPLGLTPNFDRFAAAGTYLPAHFTCQPVCGPARSCLQSGQYATASGCYCNGIPLPASPGNLGEQFARAGYATAYIGKWHLAPETGDPGPVPREARGGYATWLAANALEHTSDAYRTRLWDAANQPVDLPGYRVDALTDAAIRWIHGQSAAAEPFFLFLSFLEPHHQNHRDDYPAPDGYEELFRGKWMPPDLQALGGSAPHHLAGYCGMVKRLDEAFGRLCDALKSLGLADNTIVVFTSDHGCHFKTRNAEYKRSCHEASLRVPGAIGGPGFQGGGHVPVLTSLIDLPPTLLDAAGIPIPATYHGRSLLPVMRREFADWPEEIFAQTSEAECGRTVRTRRWKYAVVAPTGPEAGGWDARSWHPVMHEAFLYDLLSDPYELVNLVQSEAHAPVRARMRERLRRRMTEAGEEIPEIVEAGTTPSGQRQVLPEEIEA
jgi:arylsulfatase A-like enzyme